MGFWDTIVSFFDLITSSIMSMFQMLLKIPKLFKMIGYAVNEIGIVWNFLPDWLLVLGTVTLVAAVLWIIIEII